MQTKSSKTVIVFGCLSCAGDVMPPHFFKEGLMLNSDAYVELLIIVVKPWIASVANGLPYAWQHNFAPCHTSGKRIKWLSANHCDYTSPCVWPLISPDLNPTDYCVWSAVEKDASTTKSQLIDRIKAVFETHPRESVASACSRFRGRIVAEILLLAHLLNHQDEMFRVFDRCSP